MAERWYAVRTHGGRENVAALNLARQGYRVFSPRLDGIERRGRRSAPTLRPLFPGYVFTALDVERQRWRPVDSTLGVAGIVKFADRPTPAPEGFVETLQRLTDASGVAALPEDLALGERVRVLGGPFDRLVGDLIGKPDVERVVLLIDMIQRQVRVTLPRRRVVKAA